MRRRTKVLGGLGAALCGLVLLLALILRYEAPCPPAETSTTGGPTMMAVTQVCYGAPDTLVVGAAPRPAPAAGEVLVRVHVASVNPLDWHFMRGMPYVMRLSSGLGTPSRAHLGADFAGTVEAVGPDVTRFAPGDRVFGVGRGSFAEFDLVAESGPIVHLPDGVTFEQAAAVPIAALTALQALRDKAHVRPGQRVLVNGASGGVGTFAVQLAKGMGAHVTAVCSTRNVELVRGVGADRIIDYTRDDFTQGTEPYDVIIDMVGNHPLLAYRRVLTPDGIVVTVGGPNDNRWLGPVSRLVRATVLSPFVSQTYAGLLAEATPADLTVLRDLLAAGRLRSVIDRRYRLDEAREAIGYVEQGRARGKVLLMVSTAFTQPSR